MSNRLTYPAPRRCTLNCGTKPAPRVKGKPPTTITTWRDEPWTANEVAAAKLAGAFFVRGRHDFADKDAEAAAVGKRSAPSGSIQRWLKQLPPAQLEILKEILSKEAS